MQSQNINNLNFPFHRMCKGFKLGQQVMHPKFGEGTITAQEGDGDNSRLQVHFMGAGSKWLMTNYANLQAL